MKSRVLISSTLLTFLVALTIPLQLAAQVAIQPIGKNGIFETVGQRYVGHDEPNMRFISSAAGSANSMTYDVVLPTNSTNAGAIPSYENYIAFWFGLAMCDPLSYPQQPCVPDSDTNTSANLPTDAGSAVLEVQFYPPGFPPFISAVSCDDTHWCGALTIDSLECTYAFRFCNPRCVEPINFAWIQTNGVPTGPTLYPQLATAATFTPNAQTLLMNPGDTVEVSIHDTPDGLFVGVHDLTSGTSGFMVASVANGFMDSDVHTCAPSPFAFHPEYSSAAQNNQVPWAALQLGVSMDVEIGHFEFPDSDADDAGCQLTGTGQTGCIGTDFDFDGVPYQPGKWSTALKPTTTTASALTLLPAGKHAFGPISNGSTYPSFELETDVGFTLAQVTSCNLLQPDQCSVDNLGSLVPTFGGFYPFFSTSGCKAVFGDVTGGAANDFGGIAGYGPTVATPSGSNILYGTNAAFYTNGC